MYGVINKTVINNNQFINLNNNSNFILKTKYKYVFGPGDEFHNNVFATAVLLIHYKYNNGVSITGSKLSGCASIRIGIEDEIINDDYIYFFGQNEANTNNFDLIKGSTSYLCTSWKLNNMIRVLVDAKVYWPKRTIANSQIYLNNMYVHECIFLVDKWRFTLRSSPRDIVNSNWTECFCCQLI